MVLSWSILFPGSVQKPAAAACTIKATHICTGDPATTCKSAVTAAQDLNTLLSSAHTDSNDPSGVSRPMFGLASDGNALDDAVALDPSIDNVNKLVAKGKKTVNLEKSMDFQIDCAGGVSKKARVLVTSNNEG